jgi:hypothetical protein
LATLGLVDRGAAFFGDFFEVRLRTPDLLDVLLATVSAPVGQASSLIDG